jgi:hypothetical protein
MDSESVIPETRILASAVDTTTTCVYGGMEYKYGDSQLRERAMTIYAINKMRVVTIQVHVLLVVLVQVPSTVQVPKSRVLSGCVE